MPLPTVPGLPQKPVHTGFGPTKMEREAATTSARASPPAPRGRTPPWRSANRGFEPRHDGRSRLVDSYRPSRLSAEPRAGNSYNDDQTHRRSSSRGGEARRHHPYSRPSGRAEPTTAAVHQQHEAVTQVRPENPFARRPDYEPAERGASKMTRLTPRERSQRPAGRSSARQSGDRDEKRSISVSSSAAHGRNATNKRKASAAPSSPAAKRQRTDTGATASAGVSGLASVPAPVSVSSSSVAPVRETTTANKKRKASAAAEPPLAPVKRQRIDASAASSAAVVSRPVSVAPSVPAPGSVSSEPVTNTNNKVGLATSGPVASPAESVAASAPSASSSTETRTRGIRSSRRLSAVPVPVPRRSSSSDLSDNASAQIVAWASTLNGDDDDSDDESSGTPSATSSAPVKVPAPADEALDKSATQVSVSPSAPSVSVSVSPVVRPSPDNTDNTDTAVSAPVTSPSVSSVPVAEPPVPEAVPVSTAGKSIRKSGYARKEPHVSAARKSVRKSGYPRKELPSKRPAVSESAEETSGTSLDHVEWDGDASPEPDDTEVNKNAHPTTGGKSTWPGMTARQWCSEERQNKKTVAPSDGEKRDDDSETADADRASVASADEGSTVSSLEEGEIVEGKVLHSGSIDDSLPSIEEGEIEESEIKEGEIVEDEVMERFGSKTASFKTAPVQDDEESSLGNEPVVSHRHDPPQPRFAITTTVDKKAGAKRARKAPMPLPTPEATSNATKEDNDEQPVEHPVELEVSVGVEIRVFPIEANVLKGFVAWWSWQEPHQSSYEMYLDYVLTEAKESLKREVDPQEIFSVLEKILRIAKGEPQSSSMSPKELRLAALIHGVHELSQEIIGGLRSILNGLLRPCLEGSISQYHALLVDAGVEKMIATASVFGWEAEWRWLVVNLARICTVRQDGELVVRYGDVLEEKVSDKGICDIIHDARRKAILEMRNRAMGFVEDLPEPTCRSAECLEFRKTVVQGNLLTARLYPWPVPAAKSAELANGWSIDEIAGCLRAFSSIETFLTGQPLENGMCNECADPLPALFEAVGLGIGRTLAAIVDELPFEKKSGST
ncbi:hypothetical protein V8F20_006150 [Naviculisporaceae sp. PSN 640]